MPQQMQPSMQLHQIRIPEIIHPIPQSWIPQVLEIPEY